MQSLIVSYLFQHKSISLPGLGRLNIEQVPAQSDFVNKTIIAPQPSIRYSTDEVEGEQDRFIQYVGKKKSIGWQEATDLFIGWCNDTKAILQQNGQFYVSYAGTFFQKGKQISFTQASLPTVFFPPVEAERVVHPETAYSMLVGDKETTTTAMTEYFAEEPAHKKRWWIVALILLVLALGLIVIYYAQNSTGRFTIGAQRAIHPVEAPVLYQIIP